MIKVNNPNQLNIFDPWAFVTPKRRQMLDAGWPGLFREHILPSIPVDNGLYFEGFGSVFLEAQACGVPVVSTDGGGQQDSVLVGKSGELLKPDDKEGLANTIKKLLKNK